MHKHATKAKFTDRRLDKNKDKPFDISRVQHRAPGPWQPLVIEDLTPDEMAQAKGAGGRS